MDKLEADKAACDGCGWSVTDGSMIFGPTGEIKVFNVPMALNPVGSVCWT